MEKAFDWVNRDLLKLCFLEHDINGPFLNAFESLYKQNESCIRLNDVMTDWFPVESGVRQGDTLSPTLFALFINSLAQEIKNLDAGVKINDENYAIFLYADDIVMLSNSERNLQRMLNKLYDWEIQLS